MSWIDAIHSCNRLSGLLNLPPAYKVRGRRIDWNRNAGGFVCRPKQSGSFLLVQSNSIPMRVQISQILSRGASTPCQYMSSCGAKTFEWIRSLWHVWQCIRMVLGLVQFISETTNTLFERFTIGSFERWYTHLRGGSFQSSETKSVSSRWSEDPDEATNLIGFRLSVYSVKGLHALSVIRATIHRMSYSDSEDDGSGWTRGMRGCLCHISYDGLEEVQQPCVGHHFFNKICKHIGTRFIFTTFNFGNRVPLRLSGRVPQRLQIETLSRHRFTVQCCHQSHTCIHCCHFMGLRL